MKKKIIESLIVIIILVIIIFLAVNAEERQNVMICKYPSPYSNYTEELEFRFKGEILEEFYRHEIFTESDSSKLDQEEKYFRETKEKIKDDLGSFIKYTFTRSKNELKIQTYIYVPRKNEFFDYYMSSKELYHFMTPLMIKESLENENYSCTLSK